MSQKTTNSDGTYRTRKNQLADLAKEMRDGKRSNVYWLRTAAMIGAAEERSRTLENIKDHPELSWLRDQITNQSVLAVLGYE